MQKISKKAIDPHVTSKLSLRPFAGFMVKPATPKTMAYTVNQLAKTSGVSVRTLHFYDEIGLLKPAFVAANGYRFCQEAQLLTLQQILFYRELGFELKEIKRILGRRDFEKADALRSHRKAILANIDREQRLVATIDKTIQHLKGKRNMKTAEMFVGFSPEVQAKHEEYLVERYGPTMKQNIANSKDRVKNWKKSDWEKSGVEFNQICADIVAAIRAGEPPESATAQAIIRRHFNWLKQFWTPNKESYIGHSSLITDSDLRKPFEAHDPRLPAYMAQAIKTFAQSEL